MLIREASFAAIDFESAGVTRGATDAPVQLGLAVMEAAAGKLALQPAWFFRSYLATDRPIVWSAQRVHGITAADLQDAPTLRSLWPRLNSTLRQRIVVAHGAGTEKRFLRSFPLHGFAPWVDTLQVTQAAFPDQADFSLESLCQQLGLVEETQHHCPEGRFHDALFDAIATLLVLRETIQRANLGEAPIESLLAPQRSAYFAKRRWELPKPPHAPTD